MPRKTCLCPLGVYESNLVVVPSRRWMSGVLIDNWYENCILQNCPKPEKLPMPDETEYRMKYGPYDHVANTTDRLRNHLKQTETSTELLLAHHEKPTSKHMITTYDEHINRRPRPCKQEFPKYKTWNLLKNCWEPEKNDYPLTGRPTNWGLANWKDSAFHASLKDELDSFKDIQSDYHSTYINHYKKRQELNKSIPCYLRI